MLFIYLKNKNNFIKWITPVWIPFLISVIFWVVFRFIIIFLTSCFAQINKQKKKILDNNDENLEIFSDKIKDRQIFTETKSWTIPGK